MRDPRIDRYEELLAMSSRIANDLGCGSDPLEISAEVTRVVHERTALEAENARLREQLANFETVEDFPAELQVKCATFTAEAERKREFVQVEKSLFAELREDRERLEKIVKNQAREIILLAKKAYPVNDAARKGEGR